MELKKKSLQALIWSFIDTFGVYFVRFGFTIAIARKLTPREYGLVGMTAIFIAIATLITESGFSMALIQKKDCDQKDYSTVFFFNFTAAIILYIILFFAAGPIADFYKEPLVKEITRISSLGIILGALLTVHIAILSKNLNFKIPAYITMATGLFSGIIGVIMAYNGYGVWALVYSSLISSLLSVILFWILSKWRPSLMFSYDSFKNLYRYSVNIFLSGFSSVILDQVYYPLIGKFYNATDLGFFSFADRFYQIFVRRITVSYGRVAFPAFSLIQNKPVEFASAYKKTMVALAFVLLPFTSLLIASAKPVIIVLLTNKWTSSISFVQLLYLDGFFFPFLLLNQNVLNALGKSNLSLMIEMLKKVFIVAGLFIAFKIGIKALIISQVISTILGLIFSVFILRRNIIHQQTAIELLPIIVLTGVFSGFLFFVSHIFISNLVILLFQALLFFTYFVLSRLLNTKGYQYFISFVEPMIPARLLRYL